MDFIIEHFGIILFAMVGMWIAQFGMTHWQMKRFYRRMAHLRHNGLTAVGLCGNQYKGRAYAVLTIDGNNTVVHAEQFTGWTVFAGLRPVPEMEGLSLDDVLTNETNLPVPKKLQTAFTNAAKDLKAAREKQRATVSEFA